ncbi:heavy metal translocating P-type ATPase [Parasphaerochaeta coccoides]|uniref:P-type Zn(2+) transporter n=1 Tax=Parasphaerochaeta coccoides (strain ATCC BAA-1237 / DSM 17374 / SPN1) TaxID=760011 RepID=F4GKY5_PARC1|nr:heavy metal translocating P-type ATPase [Parasphaerochaeta coccoides]AEC01898.1 heavy metal translocating P-type ATPase [Parasphaerochaeta coccoides DSM 17374]
MDTQQAAVKKEWAISGLDCAMCAAKVEKAVADMPGVTASNLNFVTGKLTVTTGCNQGNEFWTSVENTARAADDEIILRPLESSANPFSEKIDRDNLEHEHSSVLQQKASTWMTPRLFRFLVSLLFIAFANVPGVPSLFATALVLAAYVLSGYDVVLKAVKNIVKGRLFDENFLMGIATIGAIFLGEYTEAAAVMIFYQVGEYFQELAIDRSRRSITALMDIKPDRATVLRGGMQLTVRPEDVQVGEIIQVRPGERIPLDGIVRSGFSLIDTRAITGEPVPRSAHAGEVVFSGCISTNGVLEIEVTSSYAQSTVYRILTLVEESSQQKASSERFITKFARIYTPVVVSIAVLVALIPPVAGFGSFSQWLYRALVFLVISCPCALVVSVPLAFFAGIGGAARHGIMFKGGNYLQTLAAAETMVFDKTGTLTEGVFAVDEVEVYDASFSTGEIIRLAASAEQMSTHPIGRAIIAHAGDTGLFAVESITEHAGMGLEAQIDGAHILVGNQRLLERRGMDVPRLHKSSSTEVFVVYNDTVIGRITISDRIREGMAEILTRLKEKGIQKSIMLTGDRERAAKHVGDSLGISEVRAELLPQHKVDEIEKIIAAQEKGHVAYVGDGINDAPVLARADIGIAMGGMGSDAAIEAADAVIMTNDMSRLVSAMSVAQKTMRIVKQNIGFALGIKIIIMILGIFGIAHMWLAIFADVGVTLLAVLNALRCLRIPE